MNSGGKNDFAILHTIISNMDLDLFWDDEDSTVLHIQEKCFAFVTMRKDYAYFRYMLTKKEHERNGLATRMMDVVKDYATEKNKQRLAFFSRLETKSLYEKLGYSWNEGSNPNMPLHYADLNKNLIYPIPPELARICS